MARDDDAREIDDTTIIAGGQQAWSAVDEPADEHPSPADSAPTEALQPVPPDATSDLTAGGSDDDSPANDLPDADLPDADFAPPSATPSATPLPPPGPVLVAAGLGLLTKSGWVFKDIDLTLRPATVAAIVGPSGTGRSCLLLALSGRMAPNTGTLTVAGHSISDKPASIRAVTSVARISSLAGPDRALTVRESVGERCLLEDVDAKVGRARYEEACAALQITPEPTALVATLIGDRATLFAVALACVRPSALIVLDDLDRGVSAAMQQTMVDALIRLAKTGPTVVLSTTDRIPVMEADVVLDLTPTDGAMVWHFEPAGALPVGVLEVDPADEQPYVGPAQLESGQQYGDQQEKNFDAPTEDLR